ncbi:glycerate kinase [bacterium]|nr:glycerate kinase [bacterium]
MKSAPNRFLLAPDSFKDSLSATGICHAMAAGIRRVLPDAGIRMCPLSDGGEGFVHAMLLAAGGRSIEVNVSGPLGEPVEAHYGLIKDSPKTAVIEMAAASGIQLIPQKNRDPLKTTTFGTGELIRHALSQGIERLILGIGGSATHDVGCGMAQALGVRFLSHERELTNPVSGGTLASITSMDLSGLDPRLKGVEIIAACDVKNPLLGPEGAARTYAAQKGAGPQSVERLEAGTRHAIAVIEAGTGKKVREVPGSGAAGGIGAGLMAFLDASLTPGIDLLLDTIRIDRILDRSDIVLTGEGRTDAQTISGKTVWGIIRRANLKKVPVILLSGRIGDAARTALEKHTLIMASVSPDTTPLKTALENTGPWMTETVERIVRSLVSGQPDP